MTTKELQSLFDSMVEALEDYNDEDENVANEIAEKIFDGARLLGYVVLEIDENDFEKRFEIYRGLDASTIERIENLRFIGCKIKLYL